MPGGDDARETERNSAATTTEKVQRCSASAHPTGLLPDVSRAAGSTLQQRWKHSCHSFTMGVGDHCMQAHTARPTFPCGEKIAKA